MGYNAYSHSLAPIPRSRYSISDMNPDADLFCPACTYNLRGTTSERCPECGVTFDRAKLAISQIPWVHRKEIGRIRAYWRTLWMATFRPKRIAQDMAAPVNYQDGRRFAYISIIITVLLMAPIIFLSASSHLSEWDSRGDRPTIASDPIGTPIIAGEEFIWFRALNLLCVCLVLVISLRMAQSFFRPRRLSTIQQNRAAALSQYGSAPLVWIGLTFGLLATINQVDTKYDIPYSRSLDNYLVIAFSLAMGATTFLWITSFCLLLYRTTHCGLGRIAVFILGYAACLWLSTVLAFFLLFTCGFISFMFVSFFQ
jgi:hypothetical protein